MLSGRPASGGATSALSILIERSKHAPPPLRTIDPSIPEPIDRIVARCLEPDPAARYQRTADLEADLDKLDANGHEKLVAAAPPPARRPWSLIAAGALFLLAVAVVAWVLTRPRAPATTVEIAPVSALVADFDNKANDPVFEGSLEQVFSIALEGASFITTFPRATALNAMAQIKPGAPLDEAGARMVAAREDIKLVFTGEIAQEGDGGYRLTVKTIDRDGKELHVATERVSGKGEVLRGVERVASKLRNDLGDATDESTRQPVFETVTAGTLDALRSYTVAQDLATNGRAEEAIRHYEEALKHDPEFGRAYAGWAAALFNIGRRDEAATKWGEATRRMNRMTDRERLRTLGGYYLGPGADYDLAIRNFQELVEKYPADRAGHINLGIAYFQTLQFDKALEEAKKSSELFPQNTRARSNYSLIAMYASDFETARVEGAKAAGANPPQYKAFLPAAAAAFVASDPGAMRQAFEEMRRAGGAAGATLGAHGLADLLMYEGRWGQAIDAIKAGMADDEAAKNTAAKASKLMMLAEAYQATGASAQAVATAREAVALIREDATLLPAALVLLRSDRAAEAKKLADELASKIQPRSRAYAAIIEGEIARQAGQLPEARDHFARAGKLADIWLARYAAGGLQVDLGRFPAADGELAICQRRRGEAMALFFDDTPTFRYLAPLHYWTARAQDGIGGGSSSLAAENYRKFLSLRPESPRDPLVIDARKRLDALSSAPSSSR
jgi:tetratricopeptide (TPR) repeat protein